jgi:hypothetical protein
MRYLLILVIGVSAGYAIGYHDARQHDKTVVERIVDHIQNVNHGRMNSDADKTLDDLEHH